MSTTRTRAVTLLHSTWHHPVWALFRRMSKFHTDRVKVTLDALDAEEIAFIAWKGATGIGKSLSMVDFLVQLLRRRKAKKSAKAVAFYANQKLTRYLFEASENTIKVTTCKVQTARGLLHTLGESFDGVLFLDLDEAGKDCDPFCPTLLSISTCCGPDDFKTWNKSGSVDYMDEG